MPLRKGIFRDNIILNYSLMESVSEIDSNLTNTNVNVNATNIIIFPSAMYFSIGSLMTIIIVIGFTTNLTILYTYATNRKIRTVDNTLIIGLAFSDIGQAIFGIPFVAISSFSKRWVFGHAFCQYYAFITTSFGIAQISMLTVIAVERYFVIVRRDRRLTNTTFRCVIIIVCSFIYGSAWATGPLLGWSGYKEEEIGIACCVKWETKDSFAFSYTISLCTFGWFIPLCLIAFGYISIACSMYSEGNRRVRVRRQVVPNKTSRERKVALTVLIMIGAFIVSWTPYSAVSLWSAVGDFNTIPLWVQVAPGVFAKCSIIWNPLIYVARHKNFRQGVKQSLSNLKCWTKDVVRVSMARINRHCTREQRSYTPIETSSKRTPSRISPTYDNSVTHTSRPERSASSLSVFLKSSVALKRPRLIKQTALNSTLDASQQINENNDNCNADTVRNFVLCESKLTQTEYVCVPFRLTKEASDKCVQTIITGSHRVDENSASHVEDTSIGRSYLKNQTKRYELRKVDKSLEEIIKYNIASIKSEIGEMTNAITNSRRSNEGLRNNPCSGSLEVSHQMKLSTIHDMLTQQKECDKEETGLLDINIKPAKTRSLEALKERRNNLRKQLETMYQDSGTFVVLPKGNESRQMHEFREIPDACPQLNTDAIENYTQGQTLTYTRTKYAEPSSKRKPTRHIVQGRRVSPLSKRTFTYSRYLQPHYLQKLDRCKQKINRDRIISDPTTVEMQTFRFNQDARTDNIDLESNLKYDFKRTSHTKVGESSVCRQSTV